jgi:creatinine amidohydrolase
MSLVLFNELTRVRAGELAANAVLLLPVGATEQHGPHLPVGTDTFAVERIARGAAEQASAPVVVAPTLPFGCSPHHIPFGGTMSLSTEVYYRALFDLTESLALGGWKRIAIVNGHGGNHEIAQLVVRDLALKHPVDGLAFSYWHPAWAALVDEGAHGVSRVPGHAGAFETSLVMALRPELVQEPRPHRDGNHAVDATNYVPAVRFEQHGSWQAIDGYSDSPDLATAEGGARYLRAISLKVARVLNEFHQATGGAAA